MSLKIWTIAFADKDRATPESLEILQAAKHLAAHGKGTVETIVMGEDTGAAAAQLAASGAERVFALNSPSFGHFNLEETKTAIAALAEEHHPGVILLASDVYGKELGPSLAGRLGTGLLADLLSVEMGDDGRLTGEHPVYGGKLLARMRHSAGSVQMASIRPRVFSRAEAGPPRDSAVEKVEAPSSPIPPSLVREVLKTGSRVDVAGARIVVSGGRGLKSGEGFQLLEELAHVLGAAVGASRAAVDEGWREHCDQVGQTGKSIAPDIYVACGISGAVQHMVGINRARCVIAINRDPDAPIMKAADYAVEGDLFQVLPALTEELKKVLS
jgi:electron transfer flavoprotein alpha subunit